MASQVYDLAIVGVGGMGSAAFLAAARQGLNVIALEQFGPAHDRGSSHGQTRIIRSAYFEHPSYVPMALRSFERWDEISRQAGRQLIQRTGLLQVGTLDSPVIAGVRQSARTYAIPVEELSPEVIEARWPAFRVSAEQIGLFEPGAGLLRVEWCCAAQIRLAKEAGGKFGSRTHVRAWNVGDDGTVQLETNQGQVLARQAIFAGGPWSAHLLADLALPLQVVRKQQQWVQVDRPDIHLAAGFCCFLFDTPSGCYYGFPAIDHLGMKVAEHSGGEPVADPTELDRNLNEQEWQRTSQFLREHFRFGRTRLVHHSACMYTRSPDEHFLIDQHPQYSQIAFVAGLSGHGFKFAPVIGEHLVGLLNGQPDPHCEFLRLRRLGH